MIVEVKGDFINAIDVIEIGDKKHPLCELLAHDDDYYGDGSDYISQLFKLKTGDFMDAELEFYKTGPHGVFSTYYEEVIITRLNDYDTRQSLPSCLAVQREHWQNMNIFQKTITWLLGWFR